MTQYRKRLIEVDRPIKRISAHARREKSIRHGHISTPHIWWARRPLGAETLRWLPGTLVGEKLAHLGAGSERPHP